MSAELAKIGFVIQVKSRPFRTVATVSAKRTPNMSTGASGRRTEVNIARLHAESRVNRIS
jgi:hypothetical protein